MRGPRKEGQVETFVFPVNPPEVLETQGFEYLSQKIKNVNLLNDSINGLNPYRQSSIVLQKVKIDDLFPCVKYVLNQNLDIQRKLREQFLAQGVDTLNMSYDQAFIRYRWGDVESILTPPLVEVSEDDGFIPIITDGLHRVTIAKMLGMEEMTVVLVRDTAVPLAVLPVSWDQVKPVDTVPSTKGKRDMRFEPSEDMFRWFGLNERNIQRLIGGFEDFSGYSYTALFRNLNLDDIEIKEPQPSELPYWEERRRKYLKEYTSAGFLITDMDGQAILLGSQYEAPTRWGPFAGRRELWENDPKVTATRELAEELGIDLGFDTELDSPLILVDKHDGQRRPSVGVLYHKKIDYDAKIVLPKDSEIRETEWFSGSNALMGRPYLSEEKDPFERLWGPTLTAAALKCFDRYKGGRWLPTLGFDRFAPWDFPGMDVSLSGVIEISSSRDGVPRYKTTHGEAFL